MNHRIKPFLRRAALVAAVLGSVSAVAAAVPPSAWHTLGERAALLAAGLHRPAHGAQLLSGRLSREGAAAGTPTVTTTAAPTVGEGRTQPVTTAAVPARQEGGGRIVTQQMSAGSTFVQGVAVRNKSGVSVSVADSLQHTPTLSLSSHSTDPQVLIMHTHTTECYMSYDAGYYNPTDPTRSTDPARNMVAVGEAVAARLQAAGIGVLHDTTVYDQPYTGAYVRSQQGVRRLLAEHPTIRVVLDLHRDAVYQSETTYLKPTAVLNGRAAAQVMVVVGMKNTAAQPNTHTAENLALAVRLQQRLHQTHPGLARPLLLANAQYNQQLTNGSLLIEIGGHANTLDEALYSADLLGDVLADVLKELTSA